MTPDRHGSRFFRGLRGARDRGRNGREAVFTGSHEENCAATVGGDGQASPAAVDGARDGQRLSNRRAVRIERHRANSVRPNVAFGPCQQKAAAFESGESRLQGVATHPTVGQLYTRRFHRARLREADSANRPFV